MSMNLGINLVEVDGATPSLQGAPTSIAGFVIRAQRGVPGVVRQISNFTQFTDYFGSYVASGNVNGTQTSSVGAYSIRGFFDNGGTFAYVIRVVDAAAAVAASTTLLTAGSPGTTALTVTAAFRGQSDPGIWGNSLAVSIVANPNLTNSFDITVGMTVVSPSGTTTIKVLETWTKVLIGGVGPGAQKPEALNDSITGSKYIMVGVTGTTPPAPTTGFAHLTGGTEDTLAAGVGGTLDTALAAAFTTPSPFDPIDIQLLACPESSDPAVVQAALTYAINRGDCMFVGHVPDGDDEPAAKAYGKQFQADKVYGALYYPYIQVVDPIGTLIWIPPEGHVMGVYARTDQQRGVWKAPAGNGALVDNALDVRTRLTDVDHTDLVKNGSVNAIRPITGVGIVVDSSRTLSTNTLWLYVNVRLLFNFVKTSLKYGLRWVVQEPNSTELWNKIKFNSVTPFLMGLWRRGAFGPGAPKDVFTVKVDSENNPTSNIQQGILNIEVYFFPSRPAETIIITVGQQEGAASASEG